MVVVSKHPEREAETILRDVWAKISPVAIPVDPARICRHLGIDVFEAALNPQVSGAIVKERGRDPVILLNRDDHPNRKRFTCAHELGHYVLRADDPDEFEFTDFRNEASSTGTLEEERFANGFAAALLMPAREVRESSRRFKSRVVMAERFRVSQEAMTHRLSNLRIDLA